MIGIIIGAIVVASALIIHELGEYAEDINPYNHDVGNDFDNEVDQ